MKTYTKPMFFSNLETRMEVINALSGDNEEVVDTRSEYCRVRHLDHPIIVGCLFCRYSYFERGKARCRIRDTFK